MIKMCIFTNFDEYKTDLYDKGNFFIKNLLVNTLLLYITTALSQ